VYYRNAIKEGYRKLPHERHKLQHGQFGNKIPRYSNYNQQNITKQCQNETAVARTEMSSLHDNNKMLFFFLCSSGLNKEFTPRNLAHSLGINKLLAAVSRQYCCTVISISLQENRKAICKGTEP
jgi:hypothetical protein